MKKIISGSTAALALITTLSLLIIFHFLVLINIVPYQLIWGGRIENKSQLLRFEVFSICINLFMILLVSIKGGFLKIPINQIILRISLWIMFALFVLNTIGNLLSVNMIEKIVFTPLTIILAFLSLRLAIAK
jgi:hypothetical protein